MLVRILPRRYTQISKFMSEQIDMFLQSKTMEQILPREFPNDRVLTDGLSKPIYDLIDRGGKRWRPAFCFVIAELFQQNPVDLYEIAASIELIHNGTLIVDDIEDNRQISYFYILSDVRRGKQCVHLIYGVDVAVNAANYIYFQPLQFLINSKQYDKNKKFKIQQSFLEFITSVHVGQAKDIIWHKNPDQNITYQDYYDMAAQKTGGLANLAAHLSCITLNKEKYSKHLGNFAAQIGVAFQIQDDILNLVGDEFKKTKGYLGEDIHEGKLSLIVIHSLNRERNKRLLHLLKKKTQDQNEIQEAINILKQTDSIRFAQEYSKLLIEQAWEKIDKVMGFNQKQILKEFAQYLIQRNI
ncbi:hypothetical protein pb186bvf_003855 [Paramecium bursaria]